MARYSSRSIAPFSAHLFLLLLGASACVAAGAQTRASAKVALRQPTHFFETAGRQPTASDVFCPVMSVVGDINTGAIDMMREMARKDLAAPAHVGWRSSALVREKYGISKFADLPKQDFQRLFQDDGTFFAKTCAVVSSSGVLLEHEHGAEIDEADLVFRFNDAAVDSSVARHVGSREDFRVLNDQQSNWIHHPARLHLEFSPDAVYVLQRQEIKGRNHLHQIVDMHPLGTFLEGDRYLTKVAEEIMQQVFGSPNVTFHGKAHRHMTTGFHGMLLAASLCKEVRAYGMASSVNGASAPYHYYGAMKEGTTANDVQNHPTYNEERELWRMLATNSDLNSTDKAVFPGFSGVECNHLNSYNAFLQRL
mmetsp:Transcript_60646/g.144473  ORF Transcript_60646/g.144473 Transcript_60646/m.144473 type:complete len:365 (-) Transcript_60646:65-1159(-)